MNEEELNSWLTKHDKINQATEFCKNYIEGCLENDPEGFRPEIVEYDQSRVRTELEDAYVKTTSAFVKNYQYVEICLQVYYLHDSIGYYKCFFETDNGNYVDDYWVNTAR
ncbi:hypothetical protein AB5N96_08095 [Chryseomicrobium imtechense]